MPRSISSRPNSSTPSTVNRVTRWVRGSEPAGNRPRRGPLEQRDLPRREVDVGGDDLQPLLLDEVFQDRAPRRLAAAITAFALVALTSILPFIPFARSTAGRIASVSRLRSSLGGGWPLAASIAAWTAPQPECPKTRMSCDPRTAEPNCKLAVSSGVATFPATRQTKMSPRPVLNKISGVARESAQVKIDAHGAWPLLREARSSSVLMRAPVIS